MTFNPQNLEQGMADSPLYSISIPKSMYEIEKVLGDEVMFEIVAKPTMRYTTPEGTGNSYRKGVEKDVYVIGRTDFENFCRAIKKDSFQPTETTLPPVYICKAEGESKLKLESVTNTEALAVFYIKAIKGESPTLDDYKHQDQLASNYAAYKDWAVNAPEDLPQNDGWDSPYRKKELKQNSQTATPIQLEPEDDESLLALIKAEEAKLLNS